MFLVSNIFFMKIWMASLASSSFLFNILQINIMSCSICRDKNSKTSPAIGGTINRLMSWKIDKKFKIYYTFKWAIDSKYRLRFVNSSHSSNELKFKILKALKPNFDSNENTGKKIKNFSNLLVSIETADKHWQMYQMLLKYDRNSWQFSLWNRIQRTAGSITKTMARLCIIPLIEEKGYYIK